MSNFYNHVKADKIKWIISFVLIVLLIVAVIGLAFKIFKPEAKEQTVISLYDGSVDTEVISTKKVKDINIEVVGATDKLKNGGTYNGKVYNKTSQMGGKSSDTRYIKITVPKKYNEFTMYLVICPNGDTERNVSIQSESAIYNEKYKILTTKADDSVFVGATTKTLMSGIYYIAFDSDICIAEISVNLPIKENSSAQGSSSETKIDTDRVTLFDGSVDTQAIATLTVNDVVMEVVGVSGSMKDGGVYNEKTYIKQCQMGGSSSDTRYIKIIVPEKYDGFSLYIVASSNGSDIRDISVQQGSAAYSEDNKVLSTVADASVLVGVTTKHYPSGEYYIAFNKDIRLAEITVLFNKNSSGAASDSVSAVSSASAE